ncbi:uncharacterized protein LOC120344318 [Styela clava]
MGIYINKVGLLSQRWNIANKRMLLLHLLQNRWSYTSLHLRSSCLSAAPALTSCEKVLYLPDNDTNIPREKTRKILPAEQYPSELQKSDKVIYIGNYKLITLPCDMGTRVKDLLPLTKPHLDNKLSTSTNEEVLISFAKIAYQILNDENRKDEHIQWISVKSKRLISRSDKNKSNDNKVVEPADNPKQKIRNLHTKLREQLPMSLTRGSSWHDFSIYTPSIELLITTPRRQNNQFVFRGLSSYKRIARCFRFICRFCLRSPRLEVLHMSSYEERKTIEVRWRVVGLPFYFQLFYFFLPSGIATNLVRYYDYMSVLYVNDSGKVWRHDVSKMRRSSTESLASWLPALRKRLQAASPVMTTIARKKFPD